MNISAQELSGCPSVVPGSITGQEQARITYVSTAG